MRLTKLAYGWPENEKFLVPDDVSAHFREGIGARGQKLRPSGKHDLPSTTRNIPNWPPS